MCTKPKTKTSGIVFTNITQETGPTGPSIAYWPRSLSFTLCPGGKNLERLLVSLTFHCYYGGFTSQRGCTIGIQVYECVYEAGL